jgi:MFS superfamily sulfate permease-like transporter
VGAVSLAILILLPKLTDKIPPSLIAVLAGIAMVKGFSMNVNTIGDLYEISNKLPSLSVSSVSFSTIRELMPNAFTIAILAAIESLLSCVVADGMINSHHRSNMELIAQGAGNITSALFGGIPATGAIARTAANIKNGGRTPIAGMVHAVSGWEYIDDENDPDSLQLRKVPKNIRVYEMSGPLFFGAAGKITNIRTKDFNNCLILRMRSVNAIDATAMHSLEMLWENCRKKNVTLIFSHVNEQPMAAIKKSGLYDKVGAENFCTHIDDALARGAALAPENA